MRNQKGFAWNELIVIAAIIAIIAAIVVPMLTRSFARAEAEGQASLFKQYFGIDLYSYVEPGTPPDQWLNEDQKGLIRPTVIENLARLCKENKPPRPPVLGLEPTTDPDVVERRLEMLEEQRAVPWPIACDEATKTAIAWGLLPLKE